VKAIALNSSTQASLNMNTTDLTEDKASATVDLHTTCDDAVTWELQRNIHKLM